MNAPTPAFATHLDPDTVTAECVAHTWVGNSSYDEIFRDRKALEAELSPYDMMVDIADNDEVRDEILSFAMSSASNALPETRKLILDRCRIVAEDSGKWLARQRKERADEAAIDAAVEARDERNR